MIDRTQTFSIKPSELEISVLAESYDKNNCHNGYDAKKRIVLQLSKIYIDPTFC